MYSTQFASLCTVDLKEFQKLLERRAAILLVLRRVQPPPGGIAEISELHAELRDLQTRIDAALAEAAKEDPQ